ncbi:MAG: hypothetical protein EOO29_20140 [Comamonadaceae bacterium]|nr:MAG: hypothetical protein EOO29_20140 [Comamonadaceae bacterium]
MKTETFDHLANLGSKTTAAGAGVSVVGTFVLQNITGLLGVVIALVGLWINVHYKHKASKRRDLELALNTRATEQALELQRVEAAQKVAERALRMDLMRAGIDVGPPPSDLAPLTSVPLPGGREDEDER